MINLISPANGSHVSDIFATLTWQELSGLSGVQLYYDTDQNFSMPEMVDIDGPESSYQIPFMLEDDETYYWKVRAYENGDTTNWSDTWSFTVGVSGIGENLTHNDLQIYPNPAKDVLYLKALSSKVGNAELTISNLLGQSVLTQKLNLTSLNAKEQVMINKLENGLYILQVKSGAASYTKKIIVER